MKGHVPAKAVVAVVLVCLLALAAFVTTEISAGSVEATVTRAQREQPGSFRVLATAPWERGQVTEYTYRVEGQHAPQTGLAITERHFWLVNNVVVSGALGGVTRNGVRFWESCVNAWCYVAGTARGRSQIKLHDGMVMKVHNTLFAYRTHKRQDLLRRQMAGRLVFEHVIVALVHGSGYERIATICCSDRTTRRRLQD